MRRPRFPEWGHIAILVLFLSVVGGVALIYRQQLGRLFENPDAARRWVEALPFPAVPAYIAVQVIQVVVFVVPGDVVQIAGGYLFGVLRGVLYSVAGIAAGSTFNFLIARLLGRQAFGRLIERYHLQRIVSSRRVQTSFFALFVLPGLPKDVLCYVAGLSRFRLVPFLAISLAGRLPAIVGSAIIGHSAAVQRWTVMFLVLGASAVVLLLGALFRDSLLDWATSLSEQPREPDAGSET